MDKFVLLRRGQKVEEARLKHCISRIYRLCFRFPDAYLRLVGSVFTKPCHREDFDSKTWSRFKLCGIVESRGGVETIQSDGTRWTKLYDVIPYDYIDIIRTLVLLPGANPIKEMSVYLEEGEEFSENVINSEDENEPESKWGHVDLLA